MSKTVPQQKPGRSAQDYRTPLDFQAAVRQRFGPITFDLAATPANTLAPHYFTRVDNALVQDWAQLGQPWLWCNPEYGALAPWMCKARDEGRRGVRSLFLVPASVGANWFAEFVHEQASVLFLNGRLTFQGCTGPYPKDCMLVLFGPWGDAVPKWYDVWNWRAV